MFDMTPGPAYWASLFADDVCDGSSQSPVDIPVPATLAYDAALVAFTFAGYDDMSGSTLTITNNGHTGRLIV